MEEIIKKEDNFKKSLNQEQIQLAIDCIEKLVNKFIEIATKIVHEIVEWLSQTITVFKRIKKGKRYVLKVVLKEPLFRLFERRC